MHGPINISCTTFSYKIPNILVTYLMKELDYLDRFSKNTSISNFMKISPLRNEFFHADGWTDRRDGANRRGFSNVPPIFIYRKYEGYSGIVGTDVRSRELSWDNVVSVQHSATRWI